MIDVEYIDHVGSDLTVVNAARVSFHKESEVFEARDESLVQYLAKNKHFSPFNHCFATFRVKAPIFVARQLVKHEYMPWNEVSRRYVTEEPELFMPDRWREKAADKKQGSGAALDSWQQFKINEHVERFYEEAVDMYHRLLEQGVCPEQARMVLPQSLMTEWYWSGSLKAFAKMCSLRLDNHTQEETQEIAGSYLRHDGRTLPGVLGCTDGG